MSKTGIIEGPSHEKGGIGIEVIETGQAKEVEGGEYVICTEAINSNEIHEFKQKTNREILDTIHKYHNCGGFSPKLSATDFIICKLALDDKSLKTVRGTTIQILNQIQAQKGCTITSKESCSNMMRQGGHVSESIKTNLKNFILSIPVDKMDDFLLGPGGLDYEGFDHYFNTAGFGTRTTEEVAPSINNWVNQLSEEDVEQILWAMKNPRGHYKDVDLVNTTMRQGGPISYKHKHMDAIAEIIEPTNKGYKVKFTDNSGKKPKTTIQYFNKIDFDPERGFFEKLRQGGPTGTKTFKERINVEKTAENFKDIRQSLDEFFTPKWIAERMFKLAQINGYKNGPILEPSFGHGVFFDVAVEHGVPEKDLFGFEIYEPNYDFVKNKYPRANLFNHNFEYQFIEKDIFFTKNKIVKSAEFANTKFDLVLGNPPYGKHTSPHAYYFDSKMQIRYEGFFIHLGLQKLKPGGLLVFIINSLWLQNGNLYNFQKNKINEIGELIDAYRLPNKVFADTDIATDIVVFKKR